MRMSVFIYLRERFPILQVVLFSLGYSCFVVGSALRLGGETQSTVVVIALVALSFAGFLLRQRVIDEYKDRRHDDRNYPNRPIQRGLVTRAQLVPLGMIGLAIELVSIYLIAPVALLLYVPVLVYSVMMSCEFFIGKWLTRHFNIYLILHQVIFALLVLWAYLTLHVELSMQTATGWVAVMSGALAVEVTRKFEIRKDKRGRVVKDTYPAVWGMRQAKIVLACALGVAGLTVGILANAVIAVALTIIPVLVIAYRRTPIDLMRIVAFLTFIVQGAILVTR
jgi:4-hydroxybenzoate polyprenyltransferase